MSGGGVVGGIIGGVIGFVLGGPMGAAVGFSLGMGLGSLIDPPKGPNFNGPKLEDLTVQTSTYGANIPRCYGTIGLRGNVIWLENNQLKQVEREEDVGGKGGGGGSQTFYDYYATFAVGICKGPISGVRRIWMGTDLVYEAGNVEEETNPEFEGNTTPTDDFYKVTSALSSGFANTRFTLYLGTENQMPDPRIEAEHGVGNVPAYRGHAYIVFHDLPLKNYGNTLPQVMFEVVEDGTKQPELLSVLDYDAIGYATSYNLIDDDAMSRIVDRYYEGSTDHAYIYSGRYRGSNVLEPVTLVSDYPESIYGGNGYTVFAGNCDDLEWLAAVRAGGSFAIIRTNEGDLPGNIYADSPAFAIQNGSQIIVSFSFGNSKSIRRWSYLQEGFPSYGATSLPSDAMVSSMAFNGLYEVIILRSTGFYIYQSFPESGGFTLMQTVTTDMSGLSFAGERPAIWIEEDVNLIWVMTTTATGHVVKSFDLLTFDPVELFTVPVPGMTGNWNTITGKCQNGVLAMMSGNFAGGAHPLPKITISRLNTMTSNLVPLASILQKECLLSGLIKLGDIDTSAITDTIHGYRVEGKGSLRAVIEPLRNAFLFDVIPDGYGLRFIPRNTDSVLTVPDGDLGARQGGAQSKDVFSAEDEMDSQLPARVALKYLDRFRNYDVNEQYAERINTETVKTQVAELPIVLTNDHAARLCEILLNMYWTERTKFKFSLPPKSEYLAIQPGDVITVERPYASYKIRISKADHSSDGVINCEGRSADPAVYVSGAIGNSGIPDSNNYVPLAGSTEYIQLDIPVVLESQDTPSWVLAMRGVSDGWPGGTLYRSNGTQFWDPIQAVRYSGTWGRAGNVLTENECYLIDNESALLINFPVNLSSITKEQMLNGKNYLAYGAHGRWEILRFQTATTNANGSVTVTGLRRGDRGTEWATGLHQPGDLVVLLDDPDNALVLTSVDRIGLEAEFKGVTGGQDLDAVKAKVFNYEAENLTPLSGVHPNMTVASNGDATLTWIRRTRVGGEWRSSVDATLSESTEQYEVEVYDSLGALVRTYTPTSPTIVYTKTDQETDGVLPLPIPLTLVNANAETGDITGWVNDTGQFSVRGADQYETPHSGTYMFYGGFVVLSIGYQDVDISLYASGIDTGDAQLDMLWWQSGYNGSDDGKVIFEFYDAGMSLLGTADSGFWSGTAWIQRTLRAPIPIGTRTARIKIRMERDAGSENSAYFDDMELGIITNGKPDASFKIYQMSSVVGRGHVLEYTPE